MKSASWQQNLGLTAQAHVQSEQLAGNARVLHAVSYKGTDKLRPCTHCTTRVTTGTTSETGDNVTPEIDYPPTEPEHVNFNLHPECADCMGEEPLLFHEVAKTVTSEAPT